MHMRKKNKYNTNIKYDPAKLESYVEPPNFAAEAIASQLVRTLMFHPTTNKLQTVDDISNDIHKQ